MSKINWETVPNNTDVTKFIELYDMDTAFADPDRYPSELWLPPIDAIWKERPQYYWVEMHNGGVTVKCYTYYEASEYRRHTGLRIWPVSKR